MAHNVLRGRWDPHTRVVAVAAVESSCSPLVAVPR